MVSIVLKRVNYGSCWLGLLGPEYEVLREGTRVYLN